MDEYLNDKHSLGDGLMLYQLGGGTADGLNDAVSHAQKAFNDSGYRTLPIPSVGELASIGIGSQKEPRLRSNFAWLASLLLPLAPQHIR